MSTPFFEAPRVKRYDQLSNELRQQILNGDFKPGDKLPTFTALRQQYGISQSTLERAHAALESEGLVVRRRGAGIYVSERERVLSGRNGNSGVHSSSIWGRSVVIISSFDQPTPNHPSQGWLEWIGQGAANEARRLAPQVVSISPGAQEDFSQLVSERPLGIVFSAPWQEKFARVSLMKKLTGAQIPFVIFTENEADAQSLGCDCVLSNHEQGAYDLTRLLIENGRQRILPIAPPIDTPTWFLKRMQGYRRALDEAGLQPLEPVSLPHQRLRGAPTPYWSRSFGLPDGEVLSEEEVFRQDAKLSVGHLLEHLTGPQKADALMVATDRNLFVVAAMCRMLGIDPNSDVLVTGYDNYFADCEERLIEPFTPLATVDKHNLEIGASLSRLLMQRIGGELPGEPQVHFVAPTVIMAGDDI